MLNTKQQIENCSRIMSIRTCMSVCIIQNQLDYLCSIYKFILTPKGSRSFFCQKTLKIAISIAKSKNKLFFSTFNHITLHLTSIEKGGKKFRIFDHTDCKIFDFKVEKTSFPTHCRTRFFDFEHF